MYWPTGANIRKRKGRWKTLRIGGCWNGRLRGGLLKFNRRWLTSWGEDGCWNAGERTAGFITESINTSPERYVSCSKGGRSGASEIQTVKEKRGRSDHKLGGSPNTQPMGSAKW